MKQIRLLTALAVLCLLAGSAFAVGKLASVDIEKEMCTGCGACVEVCPAEAITVGDDGTASVDKEKCTGCNKCVRACPFEAVSTE